MEKLVIEKTPGKVIAVKGPVVDVRFDDPADMPEMYVEDFPFFTDDPQISSVYWAIGGTPQADFDREAGGGEPVPSHHSPLFKISPEPAITAGVESTVVALLELMAP